jgi:putative ABC transport system permease protein
MLKNYFTIAWRNLWKNKTFTLLNLGGLTISLAACMMIFFWVTDELNYDTAGANADRVYRVALTLQAKGQPDKKFALTAAPLAPVLVKDFPQIEKAVRFEPYAALIRFKNEHFFADKFLFADSTFFDVFGFPMLKGDPHTALNGSNSVVITKSLAKKYFGDEEAVGKTITCNDTLLLKVTGVAADIPATSHFHFDMVCSFRVLENAHLDDVTNWWDDDYYTYILLKDPAAAPALGAKVENIMDKYNGKENRTMGFTGLHFLQPLRSIHLHSDLNDEIGSNGSIASLRIFIAIAIFLLLVACINYINLTTATSFRRAKEIGIRKVAGAEQRQLIAQFLSESVLITLMALTGAIGIALFCLPVFNRLAGTQISLGAYFSWGLFGLLIASVVILGIVAGLYPAFYLSNVRLANLFKKSPDKGGGLLSLRKALVVFQFTLSAILIVATIVAWQQLHYMQSQNLGFDKEQVVAIRLRNDAQGRAKESLKQALEKSAGVTMVTTSSTTPGKTLNNIVTLPEGVPNDQQQSMNTLVVDYDFIHTYKLSMAAGRGFSKDYGTDSSAFILNETAVREIGWGNPQNAIGKGFEWGLGKKGKIIGVVKDFHFNSLQKKVVPVVMHIMSLNSGWYGAVSVRIDTRDAQSTIRSMQAVWNRILPDNPFDYYFVNENYDLQYKTEQRLGNLSILFSLLTIFISCLGLFGLVMVAVSQRTKEIGVRKVLGASVTGITTLLSKDFLGLVAIAILIALPFSWWAMNRWLADFAYRVTLHWWVLAIAAALVVFIALATVSVQAIRAALANPVRNLRTE